MKKIIEGIQSITSLLWQDMINFFHLWDGYISSDRRIIEQAKQLRKDGILLLPNFLSEEKCNEIYASSKNFLGNYSGTIKLDNGTFIEFRSSSKDGPDKGMIDVYNVEKSIDEIGKIDLTFPTEIMKNISNVDLFLSRLNLYYNKNVHGTRIDHVDNSQPVIYKGFIYLTDVTDQSYGPYSFIEGTQRFSFMVYYNLFVNIFKKKYRIMDMPVTFGRKKTIAIGKKGTLVLSNQNGVHRGLPQGKDRERMAIIISYLFVSKLNYKHPTIKELLLASKKIER